MAQITNSTRCCATCAYWMGSRTPNRLGFVEVANRDQSGKCGAKSLNESRQYQVTYICRSYCKWPVLR